MKLVCFWDVLIVKDENKLKWLHNIPILSHNFLQDTNMCVCVSSIWTNSSKIAYVPCKNLLIVNIRAF